MQEKAALQPPQGNYRWLIAGVLMLATTINYIDRSVLSFTMLDETFRKEILGIPLSQALTAADLDRFRVQMGYVDSAFKWAYGLGFIFVGWFIDRVGTRRGFSLSIALWSLAGIAVGWVSSVRGLVVARFSLGFGEAGNYPSAIKSVAEWFPPQERALATGVFNSGANIGIILTAAVVPWLTVEYGWRSAFVVTGALGFLLLAAWLWLYRRPQNHPNLSAEEYDFIKSDDNDLTDSQLKPSWFKLLSYRQTWAFITGKVLSDPVWWFYLTWLPDFFNNNDSFIQKLDLKNVGLPFLIIYLVSDLGNIVFGWLSSFLLRRGWTANGARKVTMLVCALCVLPVFFASFTADYRLAIALIALATAAHQGFSVNNFTIISDVFPKQAVASVVGIGGLFGAIASALFAAATGLMIVKLGYVPLFIFASTSYLVALGIIHFLIPRLDKVRF
ncbi:MFS transporter [Persicitalea sp.]|uniref:MFS transporter n=1 Tax=Persicitalea sp. TaxID=3100273 RepID=UPI003593F63E